MILLGADLSQVEARVELILAAASTEFAGTDVARECIKLATAHPAEFDIHRYSAATALGKSESEITDIAPIGAPSDRQIGKTTMHGFCRGMGAETMANSLLKSGYVVAPEVCAQRLARLAQKLPAIPHGYFPDCRRQVMRYHGLGTTYGGIWRCDYMRLEEHLYGQAYSYQPVRETLDLINQRGFLPLMTAIKARRLAPITGRPSPRMHVHGHDSLLLSVHPDDAAPVMRFIERTLGKEIRHYAAASLQVPVTYQIGNTWSSKSDPKGHVIAFEYKRLPDDKVIRDNAWDCERLTRVYGV